MEKLPPSVTVPASAPKAQRRPRTLEQISKLTQSAEPGQGTEAKPEGGARPLEAKSEAGAKPAEAKTGRAEKSGKAEGSAKASTENSVSSPTGTSTHARGKDDFEPSQIGAPLKAELPIIPPSPGKKPRSGVLELLDEAEEPGVFFREREHDEGERDDEENDDLEQAVEEAIRLLFGVRGIHHIGPGEDVEGNPVVLISATQGFSNASLERVPPFVNGFKTLLALPYELLPLRRERI